MNFLIFAKKFASLAQLVEQLIRNEQVVGSSPIGGSPKSPLSGDFLFRSGQRGSIQVSENYIFVISDIIHHLLRILTPSQQKVIKKIGNK
jgi:hypothetical protein